MSLEEKLEADGSKTIRHPSGAYHSIAKDTTALFKVMEIKVEPVPVTTPIPNVPTTEAASGNSNEEEAGASEEVPEKGRKKKKGKGK